MPIYEYLCQPCRLVFEEIVMGSDKRPPRCPNCGGDDVKQLMSAQAARPGGGSDISGFEAPAPAASGCGSGGFS